MNHGLKWSSNPVKGHVSRGIIIWKPVETSGTSFIIDAEDSC